MLGEGGPQGHYRVGSPALNLLSSEPTGSHLPGLSHSITQSTTILQLQNRLSHPPSKIGSNLTPQACPQYTNCWEYCVTANVGGDCPVPSPSQQTDINTAGILQRQPVEQGWTLDPSSPICLGNLKWGQKGCRALHWKGAESGQECTQAQPSRLQTEEAADAKSSRDRRARRRRRKTVAAPRSTLFSGSPRPFPPGIACDTCTVASAFRVHPDDCSCPPVPLSPRDNHSNLLPGLSALTPRPRSSHTPFLGDLILGLSTMQVLVTPMFPSPAQTSPLKARLLYPRLLYPAACSQVHCDATVSTAP